MRRRVLIESVQKRLRADDELREVAYMWHRHRWTLPFAILAAIGVAGVAALVGVGSWGSLVAVGLAAAAVAATAATEYRVLAATQRGLVLLRASRIRQVAVEVLERLPASTPVTLVGNNFVLTDWLVGDRRYTVPKSSESAMTRIATDL